MAAIITIELDHEGIRELLYSKGIANACNKAAKDIAARAGEGHNVKSSINYDSLNIGPRLGAGVYTATREARESEAEFKTLSKAVR